MIDWNRRKVNIRVLIAYHGTSATQVANERGLSPNTLTKFLNSPPESDRKLSAKTIHEIVQHFGLSDESDLDVENIISDPKLALRKIIETLTSDQAEALQRELEHRFQS